MSEEDEMPPELRRPVSPQQPSAPEAPGIPESPDAIALKELQEQVEAEKARAEVYRTRASEMEEQARKNAAALAESSNELAQKDDTIRGLFRGMSTSWDGAVELTTTAYGVRRDLEGALGFLKGPNRNLWPYIIFAAGVLIAGIILVEVPYISKSPVDIALIVFILLVFFLTAYWQSKRQ